MEPTHGTPATSSDVTPKLDISAASEAELRGMLPYKLGRYRLTGVLGEGGMARVFRAILQGPAGFEKTVAIKLLKATTPHRGAGLGLMQEAAVVSRIHHPNIVDVYEIGEEQGCPYIAMELVDGRPLVKLLDPKDVMPPSVVLDLLMALLNGLQQAHTGDAASQRPPLLHRDIKPSNIIVSRHGVPKLVDFGTAAAIDESVGQYLPENRKIIGTLSWMSPEQTLGHPLDVRSDLFSFGLVMAATITCRNPLGKQYLYRLLKEQKEIPECLITLEDESALDAHVPGLGALVARVLSRDRQERPASAQALRDELSLLRRHVGYRPTLTQWMQDKLAPESEQSSVSVNDTTWVMEAPQGIGEAHTAELNPGNIPEDDAFFVGREEEFALLQGHIEIGDRLVTLVGTGGAGKTRLSRRIANHFSVQFAGGAWFVDLADVESVDGIVRATAQSMGIHMPAAAGSDSVLQLGQAIANKGRLLLVLDNFEQLVEFGADTVGRWLEIGADVQFLVTTREALNLADEVRVPLPPLSQQEAVELLRKRVQMVGASWSDDEATQSTLVTIVDALDRLPLAIELAAVRARMLSATQLKEKLEQRFQLLRTGARDQVERQATLYGLIDWSWRRLSAWEQSALAQLSCFRGGFSMEAAEAVLDVSAWPDAPWSLDVIGALIEKSLVRCEPIDGALRLSMFVSIRVFAEARMAEENGAVTGADVELRSRVRHADYFASQSPVEVSGSFRVVDPTARRLLHRNFENLVASARHGVQPQRALCAIGALEVLMSQGPIAQAASLVDEFLKTKDTPHNLALRMRLIQARCFRMMGRPGDARQALQAASDCAEKAQLEPNNPCLVDINEVAARFPKGEGPEVSLEIDRLLEEARLLRMDGHNVAAQKLLEEALSLCAPHRTPTLFAKVQHALGWVMWTQGNVECSLTHLKESRAAYRVAGLPKEEVMALSSLAYLQYSMGNFKTAYAQYMECLAILDKAGELSESRLFLSKLANLEKDMGDHESSIKHFDECIVMQDQLGDVMNALGNRIDRCRTLMDMGRADEAEEQLNDLLATARQYESQAYEALILSILGDLYMQQHRLSEAIPALRFACEQFLGKIPIVEASMRLELATALARNGDMADLDDLTQGQEQHVEKLPPTHLLFVCRLAEVRYHQQEPAASYAHIQRARVIARKMETGGEPGVLADLDRIEKQILGAR